jgi:hypothetical protein
MTAYAELLATRLRTRLFALTRTMALLLTLVGTARERLSADVSTANVGKPTGLVLQYVLTAQTRFGCQKRAFGAFLFVLVAVMSHLRMTTVFRPFACKATGRWLCPTRKGRLQYSASAMATKLIKDGFSACATRAFVAELLAAVFWITTLQLAAATASADVFGFEIIARATGRSIQRSCFAPVRLSFGSFAFSSTASLTTLMASTIQRYSADAHTLWWLLGALVANGC